MELLENNAASTLAPPDRERTAANAETKLLDSNSDSKTLTSLARDLERTPPTQAQGDVNDYDSGSEQSDTATNPRREFKCSRCSPSRWNWKKVVLTSSLWWAYFLINGAHSMFAPFFPNEAKVKGASSGVVGVIVSASPFSVFILSPILGYLLPWMGIKFTLIFGLFLFFVSFILLGLVTLLPSGWVFVTFAILLRMSEGIGSALVTTTTLALIPTLYPDKLSTVMGMFEVGGGLGFVIGPTLGGILYEYGGFKVPFIVVGALSLLPVIPSFLLIKPSGQVLRPLSFKMMGKLMTTFVVIILAISNVLSVAGISFFIPTIQPFLTKQFHLNAIQVSLVFLSGPLTYMLFAIIVGILSDKLAPRPFIIVGLIIFGIGYLFVGPARFISHPRIWLSCVAFGIIGIGAALCTTPVYADILTIGKEKLDTGQDMESLTGVVSGILSAAPSLGEFLGPIGGGVLTQFLTFQTSTVGFLIMGVTLIDLAAARHFWKDCVVTRLRRLKRQNSIS